MQRRITSPLIYRMPSAALSLSRRWRNSFSLANMLFLTPSNLASTFAFDPVDWAENDFAMLLSTSSLFFQRLADVVDTSRYASGPALTTEIIPLRAIVVPPGENCRHQAL